MTSVTCREVRGNSDGVHDIHGPIADTRTIPTICPTRETSSVISTQLSVRPSHLLLFLAISGNCTTGLALKISLGMTGVVATRYEAESVSMKWGHGLRKRLDVDWRQ